jgi:CheY-like chemotaxis protein
MNGASPVTLPPETRGLPTILFAEDSEDDALLIELGFQSAGFPLTLSFVTDGVCAVEYLTGKGQYSDRVKFPLPCVLLTDLKMPRMNGFELLKWVRTQPERHLLPVVVITGSNQTADCQKAMDLGANFYVVKDLLVKPPPALIETLLRYAAPVWVRPGGTLRANLRR